jgi:enoyl-CoA hydratase/3-hydroxyacyl-CoA dehydrogenase
LAEQLHCPRYTGAANLRKMVSDGEMWEIGEDTDCDDEAAAIIRQRLMGQVFAVSAQIVAEEICSMEDVDRGAKVGLRWARGPFEIANRLGISEAVSMAKSYADLAEFNLPNWFAELTEPLEFNYVDTQVDGEVATIRINRPEAMNALNEIVVNQLGKVLDSLNAREDIKTIVIDGAGKAFVAGADVKFFVDKIQADAITDIYQFTANGHEVLNKLENSDKTTIALTTGLALGGGLELALACDYRVGTRRTQFRFPETSIGIYPGLGGTQRTPRICGIEAARFAILAGNFLDANSAAALGLLTHLVDPSEVDQTVSAISNSGKPSNKYPARPADESHPAAAFALEFYNDANIDALVAGNCPEGFEAEDKMVSRQLKSLSRTAPIALSMASDLLNDAVLTGDNLQQGLALELERLGDIFASIDAFEGLSALIQGRRPNYTNN